MDAARWRRGLSSSGVYQLVEEAFFKTAYSVCHLLISPGDYQWYFSTRFNLSHFQTTSQNQGTHLLFHTHYLSHSSLSPLSRGL